MDCGCNIIKWRHRSNGLVSTDYRRVYLQAIVKCFSTSVKDTTTKILTWNIYLLFAFSIQAKSNWVENVTKIQTVGNSCRHQFEWIIMKTTAQKIRTEELQIILTANHKIRHGRTNLKKIQNDCKCAFWKLVSRTSIFQSPFLLLPALILCMGDNILVWYEVAILWLLQVISSPTLKSITNTRGTHRLFSVKYLFGEANIAA